MSSRIAPKTPLKFDICNNYLGYNFNINGDVVKGKSIGKSIGFPTANINIAEEYKIIPKNGVYLVRCFYEKNKFYGMMNIGYNPTFGSNEKTIEVNIFDFRIFKFSLRSPSLRG